MKVLGIIAEYNPFHNGHAYQIKAAKKAAGADYVVIALSGNYVQRGTPALLDKFTRTKMALLGGADLVFELPVLWATASAESFAAAGVTLLDSTKIVDAISFGCETTSPDILSAAGQLLCEEPPSYLAHLLDLLKKGYTYPSARETALIQYIKTSALPSFPDFENLNDLFGSPNNILALEYYKALYQRNSPIEPFPILRTGSGYHEEALSQNYSSATAIRQILHQSSPVVTTVLRDNVPKETAAILENQHTLFLHENDFSSALYQKLWQEAPNGFSQYGDCSKDLSHRIQNLLPSYTGYSDFCSLMKRKETTYTRISRILLHILLHITQDDYSIGKAMDYIPYLRLLGFRSSASHLLNDIKKKSPIPMISKASSQGDLLTDKAKNMLLQDVTTSDFYYGIQSITSSAPQKTEYQRNIVIVP